MGRITLVKRLGWGMIVIYHKEYQKLKYVDKQSRLMSMEGGLEKVHAGKIYQEYIEATEIDWMAPVHCPTSGKVWRKDYASHARENKRTG
eukprot:5399463-Ditylum_brightwellii.AAC.1